MRHPVFSEIIAMHATDGLADSFCGESLSDQKCVDLLAFLPVCLCFRIIMLLMKQFTDHTLFVLLSALLPPDLPGLFDPPLAAAVLVISNLIHGISQIIDIMKARHISDSLLYNLRRIKALL